MTAEPPEVCGALQQHAAAMLARLGVSAEPRLTPLAGGANNRVYRAEAGGRAWLLKSYYQSDGDPRDRFTTEWTFASFIWSRGIRTIPRPLACDAANRLALFEYVHGERVEPDGVTRTDVAQARRFIRRINRHRAIATASTIPVASEACFSIEQHLMCVEGRLDRLVQAVTPSPRDDAQRAVAAELIHERLAPLWRSIRACVLNECRRTGIDPHATIPAADRVLSPSDFGLHNAIRACDGRLRFLDFEYAGWDDPAKLVCDFFCQPAVPVPMRFCDPFARVVTELTATPLAHRRRIELLLPVYRCKWVCIALNEFTPVASERRRFSLGDDMTTRQVRQIHEARRLLAAMHSPRAGAVA